MADGNLTNAVVIDIGTTERDTPSIPRDVFNGLANLAEQFQSIGVCPNPDDLHGDRTRTYDADTYELFPVKVSNTPIVLPDILAHLKEGISIAARDHAEQSGLDYALCSAFITYSSRLVRAGRTNLVNHAVPHIDVDDYGILFREPDAVTKSSYIMSTPGDYTTRFYKGSIVLDPDEIAALPPKEQSKHLHQAILEVCQTAKVFHPKAGEVIRYNELAVHCPRVVREDTPRAVLIVDFRQDSKLSLQTIRRANPALYDLILR